MAKEESPAFQFYVKEWRSSRSIMRMSMAERGMYLEMLLEQWENYAVPDSPAGCYELIGGRLAEWKRAWPVLRRRFVASESGEGICNLRLEKERAKQKSRSKRAEDRGRAGAHARWSQSKTGEKSHEPDSTSIAQASQADGTSSSENGFAFPIAVPIALATPDDCADAHRASCLTFPTTDGEWPLTWKQVHEWEAAYPAIAVEGECRKALAWVRANPERMKTSRGMARFLVRWLGRAEPPAKAPQRPGHVPTTSPFEGWADECKRVHGGACGHYTTHNTRMALEAVRAQRQSA